MPADNKVEQVEVVKTSPQGDFEHHEKIVEDLGAEQRQNVQRVVQFIWLVFGVLEALLGLRIFFLLINANPANLMTSLVYNFTDLFLWPFVNLVGSPTAGGMLLDIPALIAMVIYALIGWMLVSLVRILFTRSSARNVTVYERRRE